MEAAQARVTALAGAREDITRASYPERYDRAALDARRHAFRSTDEAAALPAGPGRAGLRGRGARRRARLR